MSEKTKLFVKILKAELEDLEEDLESWGRFLEEKHRADRMTEYVFLENAGLLKRELVSLKCLVETFEKVPSQDSPTLEGLRDFFRNLVKQEVKEYQFPGAVEELALRKIEKVYDYMKV